MTYAGLKVLHLLAIVAWVGGMFFVLVCLRPAAAAVLAPAERVRLLHAALARFLGVVLVAVIVVFASGAALVGLAWQTATRAGIAFNMPLDWYVMIGVFVVMAAVFAHIRWALLPRLARAVDSTAWQQGAVTLGTIRSEVTANLVLGVFVVVVTRVAAAT